MVWIETDNESQAAFKHGWMDDRVEWSSNRKANVAEDVAERLVNDRPDISYVNDPDEGDDDSTDVTNSAETDDGETD